MARIRIISLLILLMGAGAVAAEDIPRAGNPHGDIELDCYLCHSEGSWQTTEDVKDFDHAAMGFTLEGRHAQAHCRDCHRDPRFAFVGTSCADCHVDIHKGGLGPDCASCHDPRGWVQRSEARAAHDATAFPLVGAHSRVDCDACHSDALSGQYVGTPTDCYYCHAETWAATTNPEHQAVGFGQDCITCHSVYAATWGRGDFVHPPSFPLTGGHGALDCVDCHSDGFGGVSADCYVCHQTDYEGTTNPNHLSAGFPTDCAACHTTTAWEPSTWDHDTIFPIYSGRHRNEWDACADCHVVSSNYMVYECIFCHEHNQNDTDNDHSEVNDYQYLSAACLECHPDGSN